jgi:hypothetical protein
MEATSGSENRLLGGAKGPNVRASSLFGPPRVGPAIVTLRVIHFAAFPDGFVTFATEANLTLCGERALSLSKSAFCRSVNLRPSQ